jgi:hypothetical protein
MTRTFPVVAARPQTLIAAVFVAAMALTGCQSGSGAQTSQPYNGADGRNVNIPEGATFTDDYIAVRNALVVSSGEAAAVTVTLVNHSDEAEVLTEVRVNGQVASFVGGPFEIPPNDSISVGGGSGSVALVNEAGVAPGQWTELQLTFTNAGTTAIQVLVISPDDEYAVLGETA